PRDTYRGLPIRAVIKRAHQFRSRYPARAGKFASTNSKVSTKAWNSTKPSTENSRFDPSSNAHINSACKLLSLRANRHDQTEWFLESYMCARFRTEVAGFKSRATEGSCLCGRPIGGSCFL